MSEWVFEPRSNPIVGDAVLLQVDKGVELTRVIARHGDPLLNGLRSSVLDAQAFGIDHSSFHSELVEEFTKLLAASTMFDEA